MNLIDEVKLRVYESSIDDELRSGFIQVINESRETGTDDDLLDVLESVVDYINAYESKSNAYRRATDILAKQNEDSSQRMIRAKDLEYKIRGKLNSIKDPEKRKETEKKLKRTIDIKNKNFEKFKDSLNAPAYQVLMGKKGERYDGFRKMARDGKSQLYKHFNKSPEERKRTGLEIEL